MSPLPLVRLRGLRVLQAFCSVLSVQPRFSDAPTPGQTRVRCAVINTRWKISATGGVRIRTNKHQ
jgi:hypothetical protein